MIWISFKRNLMLLQERAVLHVLVWKVYFLNWLVHWQQKIFVYTSMKFIHFCHQDQNLAANMIAACFPDIVPLEERSSVSIFLYFFCFFLSVNQILLFCDWILHSQKTQKSLQKSHCQSKRNTIKSIALQIKASWRWLIQSSFNQTDISSSSHERPRSHNANAVTTDVYHLA